MGSIRRTTFQSMTNSLIGGLKHINNVFIFIIDNCTKYIDMASSLRYISKIKSHLI